MYAVLAIAGACEVRAESAPPAEPDSFEFVPDGALMDATDGTFQRFDSLHFAGHALGLDQARDVRGDDAGTTLRRSAAGTAGDDVRRTGGGTDSNRGFLPLAVGF